MQKDKVVSALNDLLTRNYDAKKGYTEAGNDVSDKLLRKWLFENSEKRDQFIRELHKEIHTLAGEPDHGTSFLGDMHRAWIDFKSNIISGDIVVLTECIRGEEKALKDYIQVLDDLEMPVTVREVLVKQRDIISDSLVALRAVEETLSVTQ